MDAEAGEVVESLTPVDRELGLSPYAHGQQVWDRIAAGEFYCIGDQIRPYVDHDFPLGGADLVRQRVEVLLKPDFQRTLDHVGIINQIHSPMNKEITRRRVENKQAKWKGLLGEGELKKGKSKL